MRYGNSSIGSFAMIIIMLVPMILIMTMMVYTNHIEINIEQNYKTELDSCLLDVTALENDLLEVQPNCPSSVNSNNNQTWKNIFILIIGIIYGILGNNVYMNRKKIFELEKKKVKKKK